MKAAELAQDNPKILSNVGLYLLVDGQPAAAQGLIAQQKFSPEVQQAIRADAQRIAAAAVRVATVAAATSERARVPTARVPQAVDSLAPAQTAPTQASDQPERQSA